FVAPTALGPTRFFMFRSRGLAEPRRRTTKRAARPRAELGCLSPGGLLTPARLPNFAKLQTACLAPHPGTTALAENCNRSRTGRTNDPVCRRPQAIRKKNATGRRSLDWGCWRRRLTSYE